MVRRRAILQALLIICVFVADAGTALAQEAETDFTFRRVKPPEPGAKKRINVTIDKTWPHDYAAPKKSDRQDAVAVQPIPSDGFSWFWNVVSPALSEASPSRLEDAMRALNAEPGISAGLSPDAAMLEGIIATHDAQILAATAGKRVSPALVLAVIAVESSGRITAVSPKGAQGLMQLIPATAERFGVKDANDPFDNISGGAAYLDWLLGQFKGDPILSLAGYNAGENAVVTNEGVPPYVETRAYVPKVVAAWNKARLYCQTLPVHADDGCVFAFDRSFIK